VLFANPADPRPDRGLRLYFNEGDAQATGGRVQEVLEVDVHYDGLRHCLVPLHNTRGRVDREWSVPAEYCEEGYVIARGPIPRVLFSAPRRT
jgi:hypothetical protein